MKYPHIIKGIFKDRPNRFIAHVLAGGEMKVCHVKNTGRCRELLIPGVTVLLQFHPEAAERGRKTQYDLIGVYKGELLINMDSQAPNQAAWEWLHTPAAVSDLLPQTPPEKLPQICQIRREVVWQDSRFDLAFSLKDGENTFPCFMEVKGVTLERDGIAMFPDAPTQRGIKHLQGLTRCLGEGYLAWVLFVIQMKGMNRFTPNRTTHPAFGLALDEAAAAGVRVLAMDCLVTEDSMEIQSPVPVRLHIL